ncbi:hypothetical protein JAAARDRAFT_63264 [Jaapia argillacea MUCL 33604]|uniref:BAR domain-containing protein n=1 Tax=Jaapia argillacea MUCL 33604 TaxID=933084 RepID=A0A067PH27_9AGAM|nr:hypothetical protein JAAARDRAFT_63264 [Jaapia argillacea MUCL 33604]
MDQQPDSLRRVITAHENILKAFQTLGVGYVELSDALLSWASEQEPKLSNTIPSFASVLRDMSFSYNRLTTDLEQVPYYLEPLDAMERSLRQLKSGKQAAIAAIEVRQQQDKAAAEAEPSGQVSPGNLRGEIFRMRKEVRKLNAKIIAEEDMLPDSKRVAIKHSMDAVFGGILACSQELIVLTEDGTQALDAFMEDTRRERWSRPGAGYHTSSVSHATESEAHGIGESPSEAHLLDFPQPPQNNLTPPLHFPGHSGSRTNVNGEVNGNGVASPSSWRLPTVGQPVRRSSTSRSATEQTRTASGNSTTSTAQPQTYMLSVDPPLNLASPANSAVDHTTPTPTPTTKAPPTQYVRWATGIFGRRHGRKGSTAGAGGDGGSNEGPDLDTRVYPYDRDERDDPFGRNVRNGGLRRDTRRGSANGEGGRTSEFSIRRRPPPTVRIDDRPRLANGFAEPIPEGGSETNSNGVGATTKRLPEVPPVGSNHPTPTVETDAGGGTSEDVEYFEVDASGS